jgi:nitrogen-specific signal transduction histidine kinase
VASSTSPASPRTTPAEPVQADAVDLIDPRESLVPLLNGLSRALGYRRAVVALYDPTSGSLRGSVALNVPDPIAKALDVPVTDAANPLVVALHEGMPQRVDDARNEPRLGEDLLGLLVEMEITAFVVAPLRSTASAQIGLANWQGHDVPAVGVVVLSKDQTISDADIERLMPFATQAGTALVRASDVERLKDSTEQHAVEKEWLYWMINGVADPVILTDANNEIIMKNLRAENLFKASPEDSEGKRRAVSMNNFLVTAALSTAKVEQATSERGRELTLVDPLEGTELMFEMITLPAINYYNGERGMVAVLKNVTDLRQATEQVTENVHRLQSAEEEIRSERDRLNLILRSVPNPIILLDSDNEPILMNHEALRLLQASPLGAHGGRRGQICMSNEAKFTSFVSTLRLDPAQGMRGEIVLIDPDNHEQLTMSVTSTEVRDDNGAVAATVSVMQDVSRLRELEQRRIEQILFDSEKLAATGRLAASIAHEINNPLEAIKNSLYLLSSKIGSDHPNSKFLEIATKETDRVSRILRQMLGFYRPPKMEPTDINRLVEEAEGLIEKHLRQHRVRLENDLAPRLPPVVASADQIKQVLLNILLNAQQAMPDGGNIYVSTRASHGADQEFLLSDSVHILIRDTGKGIPDDIQPHIFEPFFSTKDERGTGLGLWVSYGIVQNHGGSIRVRSREGRGTTFSIALPIKGPADDNGA